MTESRGVRTSQETRRLSLTEWVEGVAASLGGINPEHAMRISKLDGVAAALEIPDVVVEGTPRFVSMAEKAAIQMLLIARSRVFPYRNPEAAILTGVLYLEKNGYRLEGLSSGAMVQVLREILGTRLPESELVAVLQSAIVESGEPLPELETESLFNYVAVPRQSGTRAERDALYRKVERAAVGAAAGLPRPVNLACISPGLVDRPPVEDYDVRRDALVRGDREAREQTHAQCATGMIIVAPKGAGIDTGFEISMLGQRCPVLYLSPEGVEVDATLRGYASIHGRVVFATYASDAEFEERVREFTEDRVGEMLAIARQRCDAALISHLAQLRLRRRLLSLSGPDLALVLAVTNLRAERLVSLITEPFEYSRAALCEMRMLASHLGEPFEDHVSRQPSRTLTHREEVAWSDASRALGLDSSDSIDLLRAGRELAARAGSRVSLSHEEEWIELFRSGEER